VDTTGFRSLQILAEKLRQRDPTLTEASSISKAAELHPDLVDAHARESREAVRS
jgi:hypothetical protein